MPKKKFDAQAYFAGDPDEGKPAADDLLDGPEGSAWHLHDISGDLDKVYCGRSCAFHGSATAGLALNEAKKPYTGGPFAGSKGSLKWGERHTSVFLEPVDPAFRTQTQPCDHCGTPAKGPWKPTKDW